MLKAKRAIDENHRGIWKHIRELIKENYEPDITTDESELANIENGIKKLETSFLLMTRRRKKKHYIIPIIFVTLLLKISDYTPKRNSSLLCLSKRKSIH